MQRKEIFKEILKKIDIKPSRLVLSVLNLVWKGSIFSNWNGEKFASIYQITGVVEIK